MNFNKVIEKYNYSAEFGKLLFRIYQEQVKAFGLETEEFIFNIYLNTPIVSGNPYDVSVKYGFHDPVGNNIVTDGDLKRASGVCLNRPVITCENGIYKIKEIKQVVAIHELDINKEYIVGVLVHELSHLVKQCINAYRIEKNILIEKSGFHISKYQLTETNGNVQRVLINEVGVGIEEGFNCVLEEKIMHKLGFTDYKITGYGVVTQIAKNFLVNNELEELFFKTEFWKDYNELNKESQINGRNLFEEITLVTDEIYSLGLEMFAKMFKPEKMQEVQQKISDAITKKYIPLIKEFQKAKNTSENRDR